MARAIFRVVETTCNNAEKMQVILCITECNNISN